MNIPRMASLLALACGVLASHGGAQAQSASAPHAASAPASTAASKLATQQDLLARSCTARVQALLAAAIPASKPTNETVQSICACARAKLDAVGELSVDQPVPKEASLAALSCAKPAVTSFNQGVIAQQFSPYLAQQGWTSAQVSQFSSCFAEQHWKATFEAGLQGGRKLAANLPTLWKQCASEAGHLTTPLPGTAPAAPASAASAR
jgi:hypothetical protein